MTYAILVAFGTIVSKEFNRLIRIWIQTLVPPAITMTLYFAIFGNLIGSRVGQMAGHSYMEFIVPGLVMMTIITSSYGNVVSSVFSNKYQHSIEELLIAPVPNWVILSGYLAGGVIRGLLVGTIVLLIALLFTSLTLVSLTLTIVVALFTSILFGLFGFVISLFARSFDEISILPTFFITPLTYLGGVFYSIDLLPHFWRKLSLFNPILYLVNTFRYSILGSSDIPVNFAIPAIITFTTMLYLIALFLLHRGTGLRN